jgi:hypothetical protein
VYAGRQKPARYRFMFRYITDVVRLTDSSHGVGAQRRIESRHMDLDVSKDPHALIWILGIVVTAFGVVSMAAIMGWID